MEFEKNAPTTDADIALGSVPHMTVEPLHEVTADLTTAPALGDQEAKRGFKFETESTEAAAQSNARLRDHPHHSFAVVAGIVTALIFAAGVYFLYTSR